MALAVKNPPVSTGEVRDLVSTPGSGRSPGEGHGNPLQYSCLENPMDGEVDGVPGRVEYQVQRPRGASGE